MKRWIVLAAFALSFLLTIFISTNDTVTAESKIDASCTYKGIKLYGKVQIVKDFPDITVQKVKDFPDLHVQNVTVFPQDCGKWQVVEIFPDFKVKFVKESADIKIKMVDVFPGVP
ncbi:MULTISPECIES: hypothetical protein [Nostocales]|uniref:7(1) septoil knot domain-containing protein n=3 Tax=Nostocales TaxID=1161 RepID=A0A8S9TB05_9CYAN|nr:hypothetical protein [Tolypothrix bouteillei]KAF3888812.1 hypothetical protein DA73_0400027510 [Tolypothrix bouteillei VB521301]